MPPESDRKTSASHARKEGSMEMCSSLMATSLPESTWVPCAPWVSVIKRQ